MIARIISFLILSIFMIYELAEIKIRGFKNYKNSTELGKEIIDKEIRRNFFNDQRK